MSTIIKLRSGRLLAFSLQGAFSCWVFRSGNRRTWNRTISGALRNTGFAIYYAGRTRLRSWSELMFDGASFQPAIGSPHANRFLNWFVRKSLADVMAGKHVEVLSPLGLVDIVIVGQIPPPTHGQALSIEALTQARFRRIRIHHVPMDFSQSIEEVGRIRLRKAWRLARLIFRVLKLRVRMQAPVLYYPPAGPDLVPVLRDIAFLLVVRPFFRTLVLSFHAAGIEDMETRLPRGLRPLFRRAYYNAELAIHKYPPEPNRRLMPARQRVVVPSGIEDVYPDFEMTPKVQDRFTVLFVGILTPTKGIWTLLEAVSTLSQQGIDVQAVLVGEFDESEIYSAWNERVAELGLEDRISLTGRLVGKKKWLHFRQADVFCLPTHYENEALPRVIIEAMQFALPVVASAWRGVPSLVQDGVTGFLVPPRDPSALAERIERLAADRSLRRIMGEQARRVYLQRFTLDAHVSAMERVLLSAANPR
jgi:glycosyltransferase involved in cell wall biosynthesis